MLSTCILLVIVFAEVSESFSVKRCPSILHMGAISDTTTWAVPRCTCLLKSTNIDVQWAADWAKEDLVNIVFTLQFNEHSLSIWQQGIPDTYFEKSTIKMYISYPFSSLPVAQASRQRDNLELIVLPTGALHFDQGIRGELHLDVVSKPLYHFIFLAAHVIF
jgi:hypothetical protein